MLIQITKELQPVLVPLINGIKTMQQYNIDSYEYGGTVLKAPDADIDIKTIMDITRVGAKVSQYPIWFEIPNTILGDDIPSGVTFGTYLDDSGNTLNRKWSATTEYISDTTKTVRYWQPYNNGDYIFNDVEILQESGINVLSKKDLLILRNSNDYSDTGDTEYSIIVTIPYIDVNWIYTYFDFVDAYLKMQALYEARGATDNQRWAASTLQEREILVRWNIVGLVKAQTLVNPNWSEARALKEIFKKYREFELNLDIALAKRFNDWYRYLNVLLSGSGRTQFKLDWDWRLKHEYMDNYLRASELGETNLLIDWHDNTLATYGDGDFIGTIPAATIVSGLKGVLINNKYFL